MSHELDIGNVICRRRRKAAQVFETRTRFVKQIRLDNFILVRGQIGIVGEKVLQCQGTQGESAGNTSWSSFGREGAVHAVLSAFLWMLSIAISSSNRLVGLDNRDSRICSVSFPGNDNPLLNKSIVKGIDTIVSAPDEMSLEFDGIGVVPAGRRDSKLSNAGRIKDDN